MSGLFDLYSSSHVRVMGAAATMVNGSGMRFRFCRSEAKLEAKAQVLAAAAGGGLASLNLPQGRVCTSLWAGTAALGLVAADLSSPSIDTKPNQERLSASLSLQWAKLPHLQVMWTAFDKHILW